MIGYHISVTTAMKVVGAFALGSALYLQPYRAMMFVGSSMAPTYETHSILLTEPVSPSELKHGDVVIINMDSGPIVKRIAYLPGDKIIQVLLDGKWFDMVYTGQEYKKGFKRLKWRRFEIPPGSVYLLGDNQHVSEDSRSFGCVSMTRIDRRLIDQRPFNRFCDYACPPPEGE